jgi:phage shock protein A
VTQLELEKKTIEKRLQQLEQDVYKANRERKDALTERDSVSGELQRVKKQKEELEKAVSEALDARNKLQGELDGKLIRVVVIVGIEVKRVLA